MNIIGDSLKFINPIIFLFCICSNTYSQDSPNTNKSTKNNFLNQKYLTGNWDGYRNKLEDIGIDFSFNYTSDNLDLLNKNFRYNYDYIDDYDLQMTLDLNKIVGWQSATFFLYILGNHGGNVWEESGVAQGISSIDAFSTWKIFELWIEKKFLNENLSLLFGLYDINSEFDTRESSSVFINPSQGMGPDFAQAGKNGPSIFPNTSLGVRVNYNLSKTINNKIALMDGVSWRSK